MQWWVHTGLQLCYCKPCSNTWPCDHWSTLGGLESTWSLIFSEGMFGYLFVSKSGLFSSMPGKQEHIVLHQWKGKEKIRQADWMAKLSKEAAYFTTTRKDSHSSLLPLKAFRWGGKLSVLQPWGVQNARISSYPKISGKLHVHQVRKTHNGDCFMAKKADVINTRLSAVSRISQQSTGFGCLRLWFHLWHSVVIWLLFPLFPMSSIIIFKSSANSLPKGVILKYEI